MDRRKLLGRAAFLGIVPAFSTLGGSTAASGPSPSMGAVDVIGFPGQELGTQIANADLATPGAADLVVSPGRYEWSTPVVLSPSKTLRLMGGEIHVRAVGGPDLLTLDHNCALESAGRGSNRTRVILDAGADIARLVTNRNHQGGQEYAYVDGLNVTVASGATVRVAVVDFVALFANSGMANAVIDLNLATSSAGIRIAGSAASGFGPIYVRDSWVLQGLQDNILVQEYAAGACSIWMERVTSEHYGRHGIALRGAGHLLNASLHHVHLESGYAARDFSSGVFVDGAQNVLVDDVQVLATHLANKTGIHISSNIQNARGQIRNVSNANGVDPVLNDALRGRKFGAINLESYIWE